jgi:hypothetical protein
VTVGKEPAEVKFASAPDFAMIAGPNGAGAAGQGKVPYARREYVAREITAGFTLDLAQLRRYALTLMVSSLSF